LIVTGLKCDQDLFVTEAELALHTLHILLHLE